MDADLYRRIDEHFSQLFGDASDPILDRALQRARDAGLPAIEISAQQGRLLQVLALARGARSILEVGTLAGYSTIWLARALPADGQLLSLELDPDAAAVARDNLRDAGLGDRVEVRVGRALDVLDELRRRGAPSFDMIFIDADKPPYTEYLDAAIELGHPGTLIVADNVVREGRILAPGGDEAAAGVARFNSALAADPRVTGVVTQLVGEKGHDGMALAVVTSG